MKIAEKNKLKMICIAFVFISDCKYNSKVIQFKPILQLFRIILNNILKNDELIIGTKITICQIILNQLKGIISKFAEIFKNV